VRSRRPRIHSMLCLVLLAATPHLAAQVNTCDVVGTVTDVSGAVIPEAKVTIRNMATGVSQTAPTGKTGDYDFSLLQVGTYQVAIKAKGFKIFVTKDLSLSAGDRVRVDAKMEIGVARESVSVSAEAVPALQTDSSTIGTLIAAKSVADLPLNGRNLTNLIQLSAGVTPGAFNAAGGGNHSVDRRLTSAFSANGQNDFLNNNMIDGMDNNERYFGTIVVRPSIDAVQEVDVSTNLYPAEVSRTEGGVADVITKSGTNTFHGSLYEYLRNDVFDARNYFATTGRTPELRQNQFGGSIGGPIQKDKTFFFGDYEGFRQAYAQNTYTSSVPTAAQESLVAAAAVGQTIPTGSLLGNTSPFVVSQLGKNLFSLYPEPTNSGTQNNFVYSPVGTQFSHTFDVRVDRHFSDRDTLFARYSFNDVNTYTPGNLPNVSVDGKTFSPSNPPGITGGPGLERGQNLGLDYVHVFRPELLLELKIAYLRFANQELTLNGTDAGVELGFDACSLGTGYCMNADSGGAKYGLPAFSVAPPYTGLGDTLFAPLFDYNNTFHYEGSLTWNHGTHSLKIGASLIRRQLNWQQSISARGVYSVNGTFTGSGLGDLIAGYASDAQFQNNVAFPHFRSWEVGGYIQDNWRATKWLTLNLGVRYDIFTPFNEVNGYISSFDTATGEVVSPDLSGANRGTTTANVNTDFSNISPRVGFAASLARGIVLRGGFGLSYFPNQIGNAGVLQNVPLVVSRDCGGDVSYPVECPSAIAGPGGLGLTMARGLWQPTIDPASADYPNEALGTGVAAGTEIDAVANNLKSGRVAQYSLQLQKELGANLISLGYVGNLGRHLPLVPDINQASYATYNYTGPGCTSNGKPTYSSSCFTQGPIPYPAYTGDQIYVLESAANSNYNALQASFLHRFAAGLTANVNYTWSHILNNGSPQGEGGNRPVECVRDGCLMDSGNGTPIHVDGFRQFDYGNGDLDVRQRFAVMLDYTLPFGGSLQGATAYLFKGWSVNAIYAFSTGLPTSISEQGGGPPGTITNASGILGFRGGDAPNEVGDPNAGHVHTVEEWFNTSAFAVQAPGLLGNARRNCVYGPSQRHLDFSLTKDFPIRETARLQFRAESFNLTNTPNFAEPNTNLGSPTFGEITSTSVGSNPRLLQFALRFSF
jgi:Carboxypeptidase regulatory-like domain/TonB dependent receptor-like, beta-barrel